jgi:hypothetical protein
MTAYIFNHFTVYLGKNCDSVLNTVCPSIAVPDTSNHNAIWNDNFMPYGELMALVYCFISTRPLKSN